MSVFQHTDRGTPAGRLLRAYWQPIGLSSDVVPKGAPHPVRLMGEDLVLFRDDQGPPGLLGLHCAHRCADLSYGRVEDGGLRCVYHGWLFDVDGRCLEQPAEPATSTFKDRVRQRSYPCHESGGAIWAYLGDGEPPLFPNYAAIIAPEAYRFTSRWYGNCNWLQGNEGNVDPVHTSYLHRFRLGDEAERKRLGVFTVDTAPELTIEDTRFGMRIYTDRHGADGVRVLRITNLLMPNGCAISGFEANLGEGGCAMFWHVPIDDTHHWRYEFTFHRKGTLPRDLMAQQYASEKLPGTDAPKRRPENRFMQDRESMQSGSYLGMGKVFPAHDLFVTESQGAIHAQDDEHLASTDVGITRERRLLTEALRAVEAGQDPRGVVRDPAENVFDDIVVVTKQIPPAANIQEVCAQLAGSQMYALEPAAANA